MKKLILTLALMLISSQALARTTFTTYDIVDEDDMIIGEMTTENNGRQILEHWVIYPNPDFYPDPDKLTQFPNPDVRPNPNTTQRPVSALDGIHLEKSDDGYVSRRELLQSLQVGERYFQVVSVSIAPLPSP